MRGLKFFLKGCSLEVILKIPEKHGVSLDSKATLQEKMDQLSQACEKFSPMFSFQKSVVLSQVDTPKSSIKSDSRSLESVERGTTRCSQSRPR